MLEEPFAGFQNSVAYRMYDADGEPGEPVTRMLPRSLMVPPGVPDFMTRERHVERRPGRRSRAAPGRATGRSSGSRSPRTAARPSRTPALDAAARRRTPGAAGASTGTRPPGEYVLCSRATDAAGNTQPLDAALEPEGLREQRGRADHRCTVGALDCRAPCASSAASSRPGASTSATTSGPIRGYLEGQERGDPAIYCIVDLHATSVSYDPKALPAYVLDTTAMLMAAGLDPERCILFRQSDVREHSELCWLLCSVTPYGDLQRMTQFKDKSAREQQLVRTSLFLYPVLQAADILLYSADEVPVGDDQRQHIELAREIARRFNSTYGEVLVEPDAP